MRTTSRTRALATLGTAMLLALTPVVADAHTRVTHRSPGPGSTTGRGAQTVKVTFAQQVRSGSLRVYRGSTQVSSGGGGRNPNNVRQVSARVPRLGRGGTLTVRWRVKAADGHVQRGSWSFRAR